MSDTQSTPLMQQYREIKARHRDAILFFRMGDFYEMFFDDAELGARVLGITLTARGDGVPLAGVPVKAAADYLRQLVAAGHRVAVCEQVEDPRKAKGIVKRAVVETITPGAVLDDTWLNGSRNNFIVATEGTGGRADGPTGSVGLAAIDLSTGEFLLETVPLSGLAEALGRLNPAELVVSSEAPVLPAPHETLRTTRERWEFDPELARDELARRFQLASLDGLGIEATDAAAVGAAGALLRYLTDLQPGGLPQLQRPVVRRADRFMWVDEMTRRNLELVESMRGGADERAGTLIGVLDRGKPLPGSCRLRFCPISLARRTA